MNTDSLVCADLQALAAATAQRFPSVENTGAALQATLARRGRPMPRSLRHPVLAGAVALGAVVLVPVPYRHRTGWEATFRGDNGRVTTVRLAARDEAEAQRRALALARTMRAEVHVNPRTEIVWGNVYALAKEKLFHIDVDLNGKTDAAAEAEIRAQLVEQGWTPNEVAVQRAGGTTTVLLGAEDREGHRLQIKRQVAGTPQGRVQIEPEPIDDTREPGMSDEQLRDKIMAQLRARGLEGEVTVQGDRIQVRAMKRGP